jgi:hypothetical protein
MKLLRETIRRTILEACRRPKYWGISAAGVVVVCSEDSSIYLHLRHNGKWAYPGGGIHIGPERYHKTPIPEEYRLDYDDPRFKIQAFTELEEEAGFYGLPAYKIVDELVTYEDCGFIYKTFVVDISLEEKQKWKPYPQMKHAWEIKDDGWFDSNEWESLDLHRGFTPELISMIRRRIQ